MESISYDSFDRDEDGDNVMGRIEDDDCHNACEEEDGKKEERRGSTSQALALLRVAVDFF